MRSPPLFAFLNALLFALLCVTVHSYAVPDIRSRPDVLSNSTTGPYNATVAGGLSSFASVAAVPAHAHQRRGNWFSSPKSDTDSFVPQLEYTSQPGWFDRLKSGVSSTWNKLWTVEPEPVGSESSWDTTGGEYDTPDLQPLEPEPAGSEASWDTTRGEDRAPDLRPPPNPPLHMPTTPPISRNERTYEGFGVSHDPRTRPWKETNSHWWEWKSKGKAPASDQTQDNTIPSELNTPTPSELNHDASPNQRAPTSPPPPHQRSDRTYGGFGVSYSPPNEPKGHWWQKAKVKAPVPDQRAQDSRAPEQRPHDSSPNRHKSHKGPLRSVLKSLESEPKLNRQNLEALAKDKGTEWEEEKKSWIQDWKEDNTSRMWWHHTRSKERELGLKKEDRPPREGSTYYLPFDHGSRIIAPYLVEMPVSAAASSPVLSTTPSGSGSGSSPDDGSRSLPGAGHVLGPIDPAGDDLHPPNGGSSGSSSLETEKGPSTIAQVPENSHVLPDFLQHPKSQGDGQPESSTQAARLEAARVAIERGDTLSSEALDFNDQCSHQVDSDTPEVPFVYQYQEGDMSVEETDMYLGLPRNARGGGQHDAVDRTSDPTEHGAAPEPVTYVTHQGSSKTSHSKPSKLDKGKGKALPGLPTIPEAESWSPPELNEGSNSDREGSQGRAPSLDKVHGTGPADLSESLDFPGALESSGQSSDRPSVLDGASSASSQDSSAFESNPGGGYTTPPLVPDQPEPPVLDDAKSGRSEDSAVSYDSYARSRTPPSPHISEVSKLSSSTGSNSAGFHSVHNEAHSAAVPHNDGASDAGRGDTANEAELGYPRLRTPREYVPRAESDPGRCKDPTWSDCGSSDGDVRRASDSGLTYATYPNPVSSDTGDEGFDTEDAAWNDEEENRRQALFVPRPGAPEPDQDRSRSSSPPYEGILGRTRTGPPGAVHWADGADGSREGTPFNPPRPAFNGVSQHTALPIASPGSPESFQEQGRVGISRQHAAAANTPNSRGPPPLVPYHTRPPPTKNARTPPAEDLGLGIANLHQPGLPQYDNVFDRFGRTPSSEPMVFEGIASGANADMPRDPTTNIRRPHPRLPGRTTINGFTEPIPPQIRNVPQRVGLDDHPPRPARIFREARINPIPHNSPERWAESERMRAIEQDKWRDQKFQWAEDRERSTLEKQEGSDQTAQWRQDRERRTLAREERNFFRKRDLQVPVQEPVVQPEPVPKPEHVMKPRTVMYQDPVLTDPDQGIVKPIRLFPKFLKKLRNFEIGKEEATRWAIGAILVVLAVILAFWVVSVVLRVVVSSVAGLGNRGHENKSLLAW